LKAFLVSKSIKFPKTHDLLELHRLCLSIDPSFEFIGDLLDRLNPYSIGYRYPGGEVTIEESKSTLKAAKDVRKFIRTLLVEKV
jgi:HEPN domain-containing protein